jgi:hypothetical protein
MRLTNLEDFLGHALALCEATSDDDQVEALFMTDDDDPSGLTYITMAPGGDLQSPAIDAFFRGDSHEYAGIATRVSWSPDENTDFGPSWMLVAVRKGLGSAAFMVGRIDLQQWWQLMPEQAPWFAASTAGSLRGVLDGEPMPPMKRARDGSTLLYGIVGAGDPMPPVDDHGRL